jgi:hypothetical protein
MNLHQILQQRAALLRSARLANVAFAYDRLGLFGARITRARLHGEVCLHRADPDADRPWPVLLAREGSQSVIEEHFTDEDIVELADLLAFLHDEEVPTAFTFRLEELAGRFRPGLRHELETAGVALGPEAPSPEDSNRGHG